MKRSSRAPLITPTPHAAAPPAPARAIFRRFRTFPSPSVITLSSAVSAPPPRTRERVGLRECTTISTESILATDRGLRPRLGDSGGAACLLVLEGDAAVLRDLAPERRLREEEAGAEAGAPALPALLLSASLSGTRGVRMRTRARAGVDDVAAAAAALGFARALPLPALPFWPSAPTPRAISAMPVSSVPSEPPWSSSATSSSPSDGRARLRLLVLAPTAGRRARTLWQLSLRQESSISCAGVESARKRARLVSVCVMRASQRNFESGMCMCAVVPPPG